VSTFGRAGSDCYERRFDSCEGEKHRHADPGKDGAFREVESSSQESGTERLRLEVDRCENEVGGQVNAEFVKPLPLPGLASRMVDLEDPHTFEQVRPPVRE
jgi:hypothetical protein